MYFDQNSLYHFGIFGMKWGVRRYQNEDGTLTEEGKKRYYNAKDVDRDVQQKIESNESTVSGIIEKGNRILNKANTLSDHYDKAFESMALSKSDKNKIWEELHKEFGVGVDDSDFFDIAVDEHVRVYMHNNIPEKVKEERKKFDKYQEDYWNQVHEFSNDLVEKYKDSKIVGGSFMASGEDGSQYVKRALSGSLDTSFNAYIGRHFDDYWVYDTKAYYDCLNRLCEQFSAEDYNKQFSKNNN